MTDHVRQQLHLSKNTVLPVWSVSFREDPSCPIGVREDLARNMVAEVAVRGGTVRNDFDRIPIFKRPVFNATWNEEKRCWEDFVEQGEAGFTPTPKAKGREVVYRCQPFWYRIEQGKEYGPVFVSVAAQPLDGYRLAPMFKNGRDFVYRPSFELSFDQFGAPHSRAGLKPFEGTPTALMSTLRAHSESARTETTAEWFSDYLLLLVEFGRRDLQNVMHGNWGKEVIIDAYSNMIDDVEIFGFTTYGEPPCAIGEQCLFCYSDYREEDTEKQRVVTLHGVSYLDDGSCLLDFALSDAMDLVLECVEFTVRPMPMNTGSAFVAVKSATSGTSGTSTDAIAPIIWRGKENPWGNTASFMCDVIFSVKQDRLFYPYYLADISHFDGTPNEHYAAASQEGYPLPAYNIHLLTSYQPCDLPQLLIPASYTYFNPEKYWSTYMWIDTSEGGTTKFMRTGGNSRSLICTNHGSFELIAGDNVGNAMGGRLIFEGGRT